MGMIIGALLSLQKATPRAEQRPLSTTIIQYAARMATAFRRVVFAQAWISAINTLFTWAYLDLLLPLFGVHLTLSKTLVAITRSEEHTSELQSLMRISIAIFCLKTKK